MDIGKLFNGIAVIVDNEIENKTSAIYKIKELIEAKNIPVAVYSEIPQLDVIPALSGASFIILDWDYTNGEAEVGEDERVVIPDALTTSNEERLIAFMIEASNPVPTPLLGHRCRSSQEITGSPTPFSTSNHYLWICASASFSLSNPNIAA